jgi:hypothetical protein
VPGPVRDQQQVVQLLVGREDRSRAPLRICTSTAGAGCCVMSKGAGAGGRESPPPALLARGGWVRCVRGLCLHAVKHGAAVMFFLIVTNAVNAGCGAMGRDNGEDETKGAGWCISPRVGRGEVEAGLARLRRLLRLGSRHSRSGLTLGFCGRARLTTVYACVSRWPRYWESGHWDCSAGVRVCNVGVQHQFALPPQAGRFLYFQLHP